MVTLHILRRLRMPYPHLSSAPMTGLVRGGKTVVGDGRGRNCTRAWIEAGGGGG